LSHWEAPRTAYEIAAEWAEMVQDLAVRSGGVYGQIRISPTGIGKRWHAMQAIERQDVLDALAIQARSALWELRNNSNSDSAESVDFGYRGNAGWICEQAASALNSLLDLNHDGDWTMPRCSHCAVLMAEVLVNIQVRAIYAMGVPDPAATLRSMVGEVYVPRQRPASEP
jgi:hypothetical protein